MRASLLLILVLLGACGLNPRAALPGARARDAAVEDGASSGADAEATAAIDGRVAHPDADLLDADLPDADPNDGSPHDAHANGAHDAAASDAAAHDAATRDGAADADAGLADAGLKDAGVADAGPAFVPPRTRDLALWLDADDAASTQATPGPLALWRDKSPQGWLLAAPVGAEPRLTVDARRGRQVVTFDGRLTWLDVAAFDGLRGAYSIFVVAHVRGRNQVIMSGNASGLHGMLLQSSGVNALRFLHRMPFRASGGSLGDDLVTTSGVLDPADFVLISARRDSNQHEVRIDGVRFALGTTRPAFALNTHLTLGRLDAVASARYLDGSIAEVIVYRARVQDLELDNIEQYLGAKWSLR